MSTATNVANVGTGVRNLAIGVGLLAAIYIAYELFLKGSDVAKKAAGYFGGTSNVATLGTDLYDLVNPSSATRADGKPSYWDDAQAAKTAAALSGVRELNSSDDSLPPI